MVWTVRDCLGKEIQQNLNLFTKICVELPESSGQSTIRIFTLDFYLFATHDDLEDRNTADISPAGPFRPKLFYNDIIHVLIIPLMWKICEVQSLSSSKAWHGPYCFLIVSLLFPYWTEFPYCPPVNWIIVEGSDYLAYLVGNLIFFSFSISVLYLICHVGRQRAFWFLWQSCRYGRTLLDGSASLISVACKRHE